MADRYDVVVIGGGIIGLAVAVELTLHGRATALLEPSDTPDGASFGNAGGIASAEVMPMASPGLLRRLPMMLLDANGPLKLDPLYVLRNLPWFLRFLRGANGRDLADRAETLSTLCARAVTDTERLLDLIGCSEMMHRRGSVRLYRDRRTFEASLKDWRARSAFGADIEVLDPAAIDALCGADIAPAYRYGVLLKEHYYLTDPGDLLSALTAKFIGEGGAIIREAAARVIPLRKGAIVETTAGHRLEADRVIVATGVWTPSLAAPLNDRIPLVAERGYHVEFSDAGVSVDRIVGDPALPIVATPLKSGLRIVGFSEFAAPDAPLIANRIETLKRHSRTLFPGIDMSRSRAWVGARPAVPDSLPIIGRSAANPDIIYCCGHGHLGLTLAATSARLVRDLIETGAPSRLASALAPARFA